jgi:hypothetical protein
MTAGRRAALVGKRALVAFKTTHWDRAGETGTCVLKSGDIVAVDTAGWAVISADEGEHLRCPAARLYRVPAGAGASELPGRPDYIAAEELIRDFHSARRPLVIRWLDRRSALALCRPGRPVR